MGVPISQAPTSDRFAVVMGELPAHPESARHRASDETRLCNGESSIGILLALMAIQRSATMAPLDAPVVVRVVMPVDYQDPSVLELHRPGVAAVMAERVALDDRIRGGLQVRRGFVDRCSLQLAPFGVEHPGETTRLSLPAGADGEKDTPVPEPEHMGGVIHEPSAATVSRSRRRRRR